ncbi:hypothetical protein [Portibacter lacus]|uniref:Nitrogen fixation protein n=1 Tax=Portibacter lacus TaxID=1099794 RepID=A0AA37SLV5_9BACT|nr:hypothetical protein [Portibacter lacus]GLR15787.1 hypothetical protein GCM10007940_04020 [Portibacter lacus]
MDNKKMCPSAPLKKGYSVFGKFIDGKLEYYDEIITIDSEMLDTVKRENVRTTMPCVSKGCGNWSGDKCTVPDQMNFFLTPIEDESQFENCPLRKSCRWFFQDGIKACGICPLIETKLFGT